MADDGFFPWSTAEVEIEKLIERLYDDARQMQKEFSFIDSAEKHLPSVDVEPLPSKIKPYDKNRVLPLNAAIMALHLVVARIAFKRIPQVFRDELAKLVAESARVSWIPMDFLPKILGDIAAFITKLLAVANLVWEVSKFNDLVEDVRAESKRVRDELNELFLKSNNPRALEKVSSRHGK